MIQSLRKSIQQWFGRPEPAPAAAPEITTVAPPARQTAPERPTGSKKFTRRITPANAVQWRGETLPTYPDRGEAVLLAPASVLLEPHAALLADLRHQLGMTQHQYDTLLLPILVRYAEYAHLLPASEADHHCGPGGLLHHGLDVARWAAQFSNGKRMSYGEDVATAKRTEPRWQLAAALAGLLHDIAKVAVDVGATSADGKETWTPYRESLVEWGNRVGIDHYYLFWRPGQRHQRHERTPGSSALSLRIIGEPMIEHLTWQNDERIVRFLMEALGHFREEDGATPNNPITELMKKADKESSLLDKQQMRHRLLDDANLPRQRTALRVLQAVQAVAANPRSNVNLPSGIVFNTSRGCFVEYPQAFEAAYQELRQRNEHQGIPENAATMLDVLKTGGVIKLQETGNEVSDFWVVDVWLPQLNQSIAKRSLVCFEEPRFLFGRLAEPPPLPAGEDIPRPKAPEPEIVADAVAAPEPKSEDEAAPAATPPAAKNPYVEACESAPQTPPASPASTSRAGNDAPTPPAKTNPTPPAPAAAQPADVEPPAAAPIIMDRRDGSRTRNDGAIKVRESDMPKDVNEARAWFQDTNPGAAELLFTMLGNINQNKLRWEHHLELKRGELRLVYPDCLEGLGTNPATLAATWGQLGWVATSDNQPLVENEPISGILRDTIAMTSIATSVALLIAPVRKAIDLPPPAPDIPQLGTTEFEHWAKITFWNFMVHEKRRDPATMEKSAIIALIRNLAEKTEVPQAPLAEALRDKRSMNAAVLLSGNKESYKSAKSAKINPAFIRKMQNQGVEDGLPPPGASS